MKRFYIFLIAIIIAAVLLSCGNLNRDNTEEGAHYSRNDLNVVDENVDEIVDTFDKQKESADLYHENTDGFQGEEAIYNDKYLSPDGGHKEVIICSPPNKTPYIVDQYVDPINMGTYNYASNRQLAPIYGLDHLINDMLPYYLFGNTKEDKEGLLKWVLN